VIDYAIREILGKGPTKPRLEDRIASTIVESVRPHETVLVIIDPSIADQARYDHLIYDVNFRVYPRRLTYAIHEDGSRFRRASFDHRVSIDLWNREINLAVPGSALPTSLDLAATAEEHDYVLVPGADLPDALKDGSRMKLVARDGDVALYRVK
jgi:hypothetical protein